MNDQLNLDDQWTGAEGANSDGTQVMYRYRINLNDFIATGDYTTRIDITYNYDEGESSLMPTPGEMDVIENVEAMLTDTLEADRHTILAYVYTAEGERIWHWYTSNAQEAQDRISFALEDYEAMPIEISVVEDTAWGGYYDFVEEYSQPAHPGDGSDA